MKRSPMPARKSRLQSKPKCRCGAILPTLLPSDTEDSTRICTCGSAPWNWDDPPMGPSGSLARRQGLSGTSGTGKRQRRSQGLKPVSAKRAAENRERRAVLEQIAEESPECFARIEDVCTGLAQDGHELLTRARGGSITDPTNIRGCCRACHSHLTDSPDQELMHELGFLVHSWDAGKPANPDEEVA